MSYYIDIQRDNNLLRCEKPNDIDRLCHYDKVAF